MRVTGYRSGDSRAAAMRESAGTAGLPLIRGASGYASAAAPRTGALRDGSDAGSARYRTGALRDRLHLIAISAPLAIRGRGMSLGSHAGPGPRRGRRQALTAANLIVLIPWLVFAAAVAAISWRLLVSRHPRNRR